MKTTTVLSIFLGLLLASTTVNAAQKFFKWTDEKGVTHYSETPPEDPKTKTSAVKVRTKLPSGSIESVKDQAKPKETKTKDSKDTKTPDAPLATQKAPEKYAEKCKQLQTNLKVMEEHPRVHVTDEKGEVKTLTPEEKASQMDDTQRELKAYCQ